MIVMNIYDMKAIFSRLQDDLSRKIFASRLLYSISGDEKHLDNIVMKNPEKREFKLNEIPRSQVIERVRLSSKQVILYGAGMFGKGFLSEIDTDRVKCFWDRKHIDMFQGVAVERPGSNYDGELVIVLVSMLYINDVIDTLLSLGVNAENILVPDAGRIEDLDNQYFDKDIIKYCDGEVFVDGGSYNFGTSRLLLEKCKTVKSIYSFEPDENNWESVETEIQNCEFRNVTLIKKGLWNAETTLSFESNMSGSHVSDNGSVKVAVTSIDQAIHEPVTFIKMDIEGSELEALRGAANHIVNDKPKLAISVYHKPEDILEIPRYILSLIPEYRLYFRHYSSYSGETVLYAVI